MKENIDSLIAGADSVNITPRGSLYLAGYPFVERMSAGVHDPLLSTALFLSTGSERVIFIANDVIFVGKETVARVRRRVSQQTGVPERNIMVTATHTHSGPSTVTFTAGTQDPLLPAINTDYVHFMEEGMIAAACNAVDKAVPAEIGLVVADATGIGTNRHDPLGASDMEVPVLLVRNSLDKNPIACMVVCSMHPTVLHEDSVLYSGDFPGLAKTIIQKDCLGDACPILYHIGAAGNQSPRHITKENTFREAKRIGEILAQAVIKAIKNIEYDNEVSIDLFQHFIDLPRRKFPDAKDAKTQLDRAAKTLEELRKTGATRQAVRTAEVNWFGAVESLHLAELSKNNALADVYRNCLPAEIQVIKIGSWSFVGWPGEVFVEYALAVKAEYKDAFIITLANGELQGYIVTKEAFEQGGYEASNAIFDYTSGEMFVAETLDILKTIHHDESVSRH